MKRTMPKLFALALTLVMIVSFLPAQAQPARAATTCTWTGAIDFTWGMASNWDCGNVPTTGDTVIFNGSTVSNPIVTGVAAVSLAAFQVINNANVTLSATAATTLTVNGGGIGFQVDAGSSLTLNGTVNANAITIALPSGTSGTVSGSITFMGTSPATAVPHRLTGFAASPITFQNGASFTAGTGFNGNPFGSATANANSVVFANGSTYIQKAGSNPFALTAPNSIVIFQTGSLYSIQASVTPAFSGRTYADVEMNASGSSSSPSGGGALSIDNLTVKNGTLNIGMTGTFNLKGNITVSGGTLNFNGSGIITLNGSSQQTIGGAGTLTFGVNEAVTLNNANGLLLQRNVTLGGGVLTLTAGDITTGANVLTLTDGGPTGPGEIIGNVKRTAFTTGTNYAFNNANTAINFATITTAPGDITISLTKGAVSGLADSVARTYTITLSSIGAFSAAVQLGYTQSEADAIPGLVESALRPFKNIAGTWTLQPGTVDAINNFVTATDVTEFSDWAIAESASLLPTNPSGSGLAVPSSLSAGASTLLTVSVTPGTNPTSTGLGVTCDLSTIGGLASQTFYDDGTNGDVTAGNNTFSFQATVTSSTSGGSKSLPCTITDDQARSGSTSIALNVLLPPDSVVISQVYGGGGNSGALYTNDFIELYNRTTAPIDLTGWSVQYGSSSSTGAWSGKTILAGVIQPGHYYLIQEAAGSGGTLNLPTPDAIGTILMSATAAKVALVYDSTTITGKCATGANISDFVGYGTANCAEGSPTAGLGNSTAAIRKSDVVYGLQDTNNNSNDFTVGDPIPHNSVFPWNGSGQADPYAILKNQTSLLTVVVTPDINPVSTGITVSCDLSPVGGSATQALYDNATNGDVVAGDNTFSYLVTATSLNTQDLVCTYADAQHRTGTAKISLDVLEIIPIGTVNGTIADGSDAPSHNADFNGKAVAIQGVIYEKTLAATDWGGTYYAFFIQNTTSTRDNDPNSSDGLYVYMSTSSSMDGPGATTYTPAVGDEVVLIGTVTEYFNMTELTNTYLALPIVDSGVDIDSELNTVIANPPVSLVDANVYWERLQGMRVQVPQNSIVLGGRNVFSPTDAEIWVARSDSTVATRTGPLYNDYTRRAFRDANILDDNYDAANWDGNGYRILMGSLGIKFTANNEQALIAPARTFDKITNAPIGGINYSFSKYRIEVTTQPALSDGVDPAANNPPTTFDRSVHYTIVDYNLENLYDYRNNPASGCDFADDTGCSNTNTQYLSAVTPPYDYVPASDAVYQARLKDIALQIINDLHSPDILMVQEVENQDICTITLGALDCGSTDNRDGKPDVLQELALKIASLPGGQAYDAAFDRDSSDLRGIAPAFLYRTDRVQLVNPVGDPVLGGNPAIVYAGDSVTYDSDVSNPKTLNAKLPTGFTGACENSWVFPRAPDIGLFRIYSKSISVGNYYRDVYVINNHFKSGPDSCVKHRTEQAKYNAAIVAFLQAANPYARIVLGGDLNVYPRPDDPFAPIGQPTSSDQLGSLYDPGLGLKNLWEVLLGQAPEAAYSYVYLGMAQTLDQMFVNQMMFTDLNQFRIAHINSDFPADYPDDVARGTSDHDPNVATFNTFSGFFQPIADPPAINIVTAGNTIPVKFSLGGNKGLNIFAAGYPQSSLITCVAGTIQDDTKLTVSPGKNSLLYDPLSNQYTYTWKTDKKWAGTCRQLTVMLKDGTVQIANFQFK